MRDDQYPLLLWCYGGGPTVIHISLQYFFRRQRHRECRIFFRLLFVRPCKTSVFETVVLIGDVIIFIDISIIIVVFFFTVFQHHGRGERRWNRTPYFSIATSFLSLGNLSCVCASVRTIFSRIFLCHPLL